jgi:hypothetical protein
VLRPSPGCPAVSLHNKQNADVSNCEQFPRMRGSRSQLVRNLRTSDSGSCLGHQAAEISRDCGEHSRTFGWIDSVRQPREFRLFVGNRFLLVHSSLLFLGSYEEFLKAKMAQVPAGKRSDGIGAEGKRKCVAGAAVDRRFIYLNSFSPTAAFSFGTSSTASGLKVPRNHEHPSN